MESFKERACKMPLLIDPYDMKGFCRVARLSRDHGYVFVNIPKSGGNSVRAALIRSESMLANGEPRVKNNASAYDNIYFLRTNMDLSMGWYLAHSIHNAPVFSFVRNPYARILSAYNEKIYKTYRMLKGDARYPVSKKRQRVRRLNELGLPLGREASFEEFLGKVTATKPASLDQHFAPQSYILAMGRISYTVIGSLENYDADMDVVSECAFGDATLWRRAENASGGARNVNPEGGGAVDRIRDCYTQNAIDLVTRYYASDFEALGYSMDPERADEPPSSHPFAGAKSRISAWSAGCVAYQLSARNLGVPKVRGLIKRFGW